MANKTNTVVLLGIPTLTRDSTIRTFRLQIYQLNRKYLFRCRTDINHSTLPMNCHVSPVPLLGRAQELMGRTGFLCEGGCPFVNDSAHLNSCQGSWGRFLCHTSTLYPFRSARYFMPERGISLA